MDLLLGSRRRTRATVCRTVAEYSGTWGWPVLPGAGLVRDGDTLRCSCARADCPAPGRHPIATGCVRVPSGSDVHQVRELWRFGSDTAVLLPAGHSFDVLDVPERAGSQALARLERIGTRIGPVLSTPDSRAGSDSGSVKTGTRRALFFVAPGAAPSLPELLYKTGWDDAHLDLACHGTGTWIPAPPTVLGPLGPASWLRSPAADTVFQPPQARLLLGTLAYTCHRTRRGPPSGRT